MIDESSIARSHADHIRRIIDDGKAVRIDAYDNTATIYITPPGADGMRHISVRTDDDGEVAHAYSSVPEITEKDGYIMIRFLQTVPNDVTSDGTKIIQYLYTIYGADTWYVIAGDAITEIRAEESL